VEYVEFCIGRGINPQWTSPHTSAHNGRVERLHLTLFNSSRAMCLNAGLPPNQWDEFILTAAYLRIRVPTKSLKGITPLEAYSGVKPNVGHLREIGSRAFILILNKHNPKVYQRSEECVLIGYSKDSKSYRVYHRASHKVFESFHVVFIESKDDTERPFRPGVTQGLGDDDPLPAESILAPTAPLASNTPVISSPAVVTSVTPVNNTSVDESSEVSMPPKPLLDPPPTTSIPALRRSSHLPLPSSRLAEASGLQKIDAV
jgi:hypothetical protein